MASTKTILKSASTEEINKHFIETLGGSMEAHKAKKSNFHKKGLPFYTCVGDNEWTKEFPNGEIHLVARNVDLNTFEKTETLIRKLTSATTIKKTPSLKIK